MRLIRREGLPNGDHPVAVQASIGAIALVLATLLLLAVRAHMSPAASAGHLALAALFMAAIPGYYTLLSVVLKAYQGRRVQPVAAL